MTGREPPLNLHATAIRIAGRGILIRGPARSGKSALALSALRRAEALRLEAALVADDRVLVAADEGGVVACAPASIQGFIEISGVGIVRETTVARARLDLVVDLLEPGAIDRMPETRTVALCGVRLRLVILPAREAAFGADVLNSLALRPDDGDLYQI